MDKFSIYQHAFLEDRQILDTTLAGNKASKRLKSSNNGVINKPHIQVYDHITWNFLPAIFG